jgi:hypothetical protein
MVEYLFDEFYYKFDVSSFISHITDYILQFLKLVNQNLNGQAKKRC